MKKTKAIACSKCCGRGYIGHYESGNGYACSWREHCQECNGQGYIEVPVTNADRIKKMSNEELADFIDDIYDDGYNDGWFAGFPSYDDTSKRRSNYSNKNKVKEWLNQPVGEIKD